MKRKHSVYATVIFSCPNCKEKIMEDFTDGSECGCGNVWTFPTPVCNNNHIKAIKKILE